jgi:hypothetical protein
VQNWAVSASGAERADKPGGPGFWVAAITPPERSTGDRVTVEGLEFSTPGAAHAEIPPGRRVDSAFGRAVLDRYRRDPMMRWRACLAAGEPLDAGGADEFPDPILEGLARTTGRQWSEVLDRIRAADPRLSRKFRARLAGVLDIGGGVAMPFWPAESESVGSLGLLLRELARARADAGKCEVLVQTWLAQQPIGGAVVIDDAAAIDLTAGITFPSVLLANLADAPVAASAARAEVNEGDLLRIEPMTVVFADVGAERRTDESLSGRRRIGLDAAFAAQGHRVTAATRVGEWRAERSVVGEVVRIRPPGLDIGPLMSDWTQRAFLASAIDPSPLAPMPTSASDRGFIGRLYRAADLEKAAPDHGSPGPGRWTLYFEIAGTTPAGAEPGEDRSEIDLYFGPRGGAASQELRVLGNGTLIDARAGRAVPSGMARCSRAADRTALWVPVPATAIEAGKVLRLGLVRIDASGKRSAWPRPMLPWQTEPGRIAVDLSAWSPVKE